MQPGPSLPPPSQISNDPFLSHNNASSTQPRQLRVTNGSVPNSPSSGVITSPPLPSDPDNSQGSGNGGQSKLAQSVTRQELDKGSITSVPDQLQALEDSRSRPLPVLPNITSHRKKPSTVEEVTEEEETEDEGADVIRFPSAFSDRHTLRSTHSDEPPPLPPKPVVDSPVIPPSPASIPPPGPAINRQPTHDTIRLTGLRSPSPPLSRNTSYAESSAIGRSPRSPSIQTLSQLSVVKMRLARLEPGEARVLPSTSPRQPQTESALAGSARIDLNTPPLTIRKRPDTLPSPTLPHPSTADESARESTAYESARGDDALTDSSSTETTTSVSVNTPPSHCGEVDLGPLISMLKPLPPQYAIISSTMEGVKDSLEHVRTGVHRVLNDIGPIREGLASMQSNDASKAADNSGDESLDHIRRQLSELVMLVADGFARRNAIADDGAQDTDKPLTLKNIGQGESSADFAVANAVTGLQVKRPSSFCVEAITH